MRLKSITFILENCDYVTIDGKYIGDFIVEDIDTSVRRIACNAICKMVSASIIAIEIHKDANKKRNQFGCFVAPEGFSQMTFDTLSMYNDITEIKFELEDEYHPDEPVESYEYYTDWTGDSDYTNEAQKTYISKDGNLYIVIADGKQIEDFFDKEDIDDKDYMDFHFSMYDVGDANYKEVKND